jgi:hypothetical protein
MLSLIFATVCSVYLLYCWRKQRLYNGVALMHGQWIRRDENPLIYWVYMALISFLNGVLIYEGITHIAIK